MERVTLRVLTHRDGVEGVNIRVLFVVNSSVLLVFENPVLELLDAKHGQLVQPLELEYLLVL